LCFFNVFVLAFESIVENIQIRLFLDESIVDIFIHFILLILGQFFEPFIQLSISFLKCNYFFVKLIQHYFAVGLSKMDYQIAPAFINIILGFWRCRSGFRRPCPSSGRCDPSSRLSFTTWSLDLQLL